ncbi:MAG: hypothetical protein IT423_16395 [Pirellulaceae bacterium]|nr:hypothetical protein [Pirellulaceae bacterium]
MNKFLRAEHRFYGSIAAVLLASLLALVVSLPSRATEPDDQAAQKSSRKARPTQVTPSQPAPTKASDKPAAVTDQPSAAKSKTEDNPDSLELDASSGSKPESVDKEKMTGAKEKAPVQSGSLTNELREGPESVKLLSAQTEDKAATIQAQQNKDQGECPGSEASKVPATQNLNDIPLEQDEHPFDAPAAETDDDQMDEAPIDDDSSKGQADAKSKTNGKSEKLAPITPRSVSRDQSSLRLEQRINMCLAYYFTHQENLAKRSPWAVMHTILPFGVETDIIAGNRRVNAIGWMCYNGVCKSQRVFQSTKSGFRTNVGPGVQGHEGQFLAILAQSSVPRSFPIVVGKTRYTVSDLIRYEMVTCREKSELTFKLIGLSHYLSAQQAWRDDRGHTWNLEKLVSEELDQPIVGAACGGTHRLMGLSYALMMRRRYQQPIVGHWARADEYLKDFIRYAWTLQNPDGSFSTEWFEGRANEADMERKVQTTGHILEWLIFALPAEELDDPRVAKSLEVLLSQVYDHRDQDWPIGPRGHSLRAISLYNQRFFGAPTGQLKVHLAQTGYMKELR